MHNLACSLCIHDFLCHLYAYDSFCPLSMHDLPCPLFMYDLLCSMSIACLPSPCPCMICFVVFLCMICHALHYVRPALLFVHADLLCPLPFVWPVLRSALVWHVCSLSMSDLVATIAHICLSVLLALMLYVYDVLILLLPMYIWWPLCTHYFNKIRHTIRSYCSCPCTSVHIPLWLHMYMRFDLAIVLFTCICIPLLRVIPYYMYSLSVYIQSNLFMIL